MKLRRANCARIVRTWWRNDYGAVTDGDFEIYRDTPESLHASWTPAWMPMSLWDVRSGAAVHMGNFTTTEQAKAAALPNAPARRPA